MIRAGFLAAILLLGLAAACSPAPSPPTGSTVPFPPTATPGATQVASENLDPDASAPPVPFDGLYVNDLLSVTGDATVAVVRSGLGCLALEHVLGAGEWSVVGRESERSGTGSDAPAITILSLQNGTETALAMLGGGDTCTARIERTTTSSVSISGDVSFAGEAALDEPICLTAGKSVSLGVAYRTPGGPNAIVSVSVPARIGLARLDPDNVEVHVTRGAMGLGQLAGLMLAGLRTGDTGSGVEGYAPADSSRLTLDVQALNPFKGRLHLTDLEGDAGSISLDGDVECHLPGGALDRAAEAAAAGATPAPSGATGTPGPTIAPLPGVESGTVVATGGAIAGTYRLPASDLDCFYDQDAGAWTIQTVGGSDPTFYLYLFMANGGGATDKVSMGLVVGDGSNGRMSLFDSSISPAVGTVNGNVALAGTQLTIVVQGKRADGGTLAANLSCPAT